MPVTLSNPNSVTTPDWLNDTSAADSLRQYQSQLPQLFDTSPLRQAAENYNQSFATRAEMGFDAQARAAQNRAMLSGGRVGASFAKGGLMLGLQNNLNSMQLDYAKLAAQMQAQRAQAQGQVAGQLADYGQRHQSQLADWTSGQQGMGLQAQSTNVQEALAKEQMKRQAAQESARLKQQAWLAQAQMSMQSKQFDKSYGLQERSLNSQLSNDALQRSRMSLSSLGNRPNYYGTGFTPIDTISAQNQYDAQRSSLISQMLGGGRF